MPDPNRNGAPHFPGNAISKEQIGIQLEPKDSETAFALQAEKLRRLYSFCHATAAEIARLCFGVCR
jgi:hypothetical protein